MMIKENLPKVSEYDQEIPQLQTADQLKHCEEETQTTDSYNTIKVKHATISLFFSKIMLNKKARQEPHHKTRTHYNTHGYTQC